MSFVVVATFVMINMFVAVVINSREETKALDIARVRDPATQGEILNELCETREALARLEAKITSVGPR